MRKESTAGFFLGLALVLMASPGRGQELVNIPRPSDPRNPPGDETLTYDIGFLIFKNAAVGTLTMKRLPGPNRYEGVVSAQTKGFVAFVSSSRKDTYRSVMSLSRDGKLMTIEFQKDVRMGSSHARSTTVLDYKAGVMRWKSTEVKGDDRRVKNESHPIPAGVVYEDFISAFFNLRRGVYGPVAPGKRYRLLSIPTRKWFKDKQKKPQHFFVDISKRRTDGRSQIIVSIIVPDDLFGQKVGAVQFHLRRDLIPSLILVKNAILFGDMKGKLRKVEITHTLNPECLDCL